MAEKPTMRMVEIEYLEWAGAKIKALSEVNADLLEALERIATSPHQDYSTNEHSLYGTGVADGHKCAANLAKQAIEKAR